MGRLAGEVRGPAWRARRAADAVEDGSVQDANAVHPERGVEGALDVLEGAEEAGGSPSMAKMALKMGGLLSGCSRGRPST